MSASSLPFAQRVMFVLLAFSIVFATGCGPRKPSAGGQYHIDQDGTGFGKGADKIILTLHSNSKFEVMAGELTMLSGKWEAKDGMVTFTQGQGAIVVNYRIEDKKLIPIKDGQEVKGWRWAK